MYLAAISSFGSTVSVPNLDDWRQRWERPVLQQLGIHGDTIERGYARMLIKRSRDMDELFFRTALTIAADLAAISAVNSQREEGVQVANGTAELHLSFLSPLPDIVTVSARVTHWADYATHLAIEAHGPNNELLVTGLTTYSLRPIEEIS
jgi:acyl-coenzyme A thioesterase PaaI-like protein